MEQCLLLQEQSKLLKTEQDTDMNSLLKKITYTLAASLFMVSVVFAQEQSPVEFTFADNSDMKINGTSTIHDWTSDVQTIKGTIKLPASWFDKDKVEEGNEVVDVDLEIPVKSIESGKSGMNKNTYEALKHKKHPTIYFNLQSASIAEVKEGDKEFTLNTSGSLTVAGTTKNISMNVSGKRLDDKTFSFKGSHTMKMSEFNIEPPSAMWGTVTAGDEITISFDLTAKPSPNM